MLKTSSVVTLLALISATLANDARLDCAGPPPENEYKTVNLGGKCKKDVRYVSNLDFGLFSGAWYTHWGTDTGTSAGCNGNCRTFYLARITDSRYTAAFCCNKNGQNFCGDTVGSGEITIPDSSDPGAFLITVQGKEPSVDFLLDVQYDDFFVAYRCDPKTGKEYINIASRYTKIPECLKKKALDLALTALNGDVSIIKEVKQPSDCPYLWKY